jgi:SAM-dependent methyltransferase
MFSRNQKNKIIVGNCYNDFPELYDLFYERYLKAVPAFVELVAKNTPVDENILDLAAGTGEVSIPLIKKGYGVTSFDKSRRMLDILEEKACQEKIIAKTVVGNINRVSIKKTFRTICIRQAINYYKNAHQLTKGLGYIIKHLDSDGKFIFNAPNYSRGTVPFNATNIYKKGGLSAFVLETNSLKNDVLSHRQDIIVWKEGDSAPVHYVDSNTFCMFTKEQFEKALVASGFADIKFLSSGLSPYKKTDKTLYCVAQKS